MKDRIALLLAALWWGSLTTIGFLVVPMLFAQLGNPRRGGQLRRPAVRGPELGGAGLRVGAADPFQVARSGDRVDAVVAHGRRRGSSSALLLALLQEYAVAPRILARENLKLWHSLGSAMYLGQWLCAGVLLWRMGRRPRLIRPARSA